MQRIVVPNEKKKENLYFRKVTVILTMIFVQSFQVTHPDVSLMENLFIVSALYNTQVIQIKYHNLRSSL